MGYTWYEDQCASRLRRVANTYLTLNDLRFQQQYSVIQDMTYSFLLPKVAPLNLSNRALPRQIAVKILQHLDTEIRNKEG
jgi:hypothetical protein